jgi:plasmid stabilization system protein ParE
MKYRVFWTPDAENDLATLWIDAANRDEVSRVADQIDRLLHEDAHLQGESRDENSRVLFALPFVVEFAVVESAQDVYVVGIWKARNR